MELPEAIWAIVERSRGRLFCRKQAFKAGFSDGSLDRWLRAGLTERLAPGWYRIVDDVIPPDQLLWLGVEYQRHRTGDPPALVTGGGALGRYGVPGFDMNQTAILLLNHGDRVRIKSDPFVVLTADLTRVERRSVRGIDLATPPRCLADLPHDPRVQSRADLIDAVDRTRNHLRLPLPELMEAWVANGRHRGAAQLLGLANAGVFDVESGGERKALQQIFAHCAGPPDCQVVVLGELRADFVYLFANLIIEYHGGPHEGLTDRDATRIMALEQAGYRVIILTKSMLRDPVRTAAHIDAIRSRREQLVLQGSLERAALPVQPARRVALRTLVPLG